MKKKETPPIGADDVIACQRMIHNLCAAIDAGRLTVADEHMLEVGRIVQQCGGPFRDELLSQLASRVTDGDAIRRLGFH